ncbi:MAG: helicase-exonuclease AddAB subunit AddA [Lachnospiraceae bacterium]|nr:helicase-exonuclease AddAB subunit AddA [Lachnospiraceae bacterium]
MATSWTDEQLKVINHKDGNLLVAAAAGSGKTAVLSERVLKLLLDEKAGFDVDRLLIVTFTRAAAAEMRDRIGKKISDYVKDNPFDTHMRRQATLINNATIATIDSFCNQIVHEYFHVIDLDPSFRIADEAETARMQTDTLKAIIEEHYAAKDEAFIALSNCYASGNKQDSRLEELVLTLYNAAESNPYPMYWLRECLKSGCFESVEELDASGFAKDILQKSKAHIKGFIELIQAAVETALLPEGPEQYLEALNSDLEYYRSLLKAETYSALHEKMKAVNFAKLSGKRDGSPELKAKAKADRDKAKKEFEKLSSTFFPVSLEDLIASDRSVFGHLLTLTDLTEEFSERLMKLKKELGIYTFSDIEHMALYILVSDDPEHLTLTPAAESLRERYDYIIVDEYQDSNLLQECILNAISKKNLITADHPEGEPNIFMVGDVKQSIYRFRQAKPELFMEKYDTYPDDGLYRKIILRKNFRSRQQVLDGSNIIFEWCMHKSFGGIEYDKEAALYVGNSEYTDVENEKFNPELILVKKDMQDSAENDNYYQEAYSTAEYIKKITSPDSDFRVMHDKVYEKVRYSDIAILLRSTTEWAEKFTTVLSDEGIPVTANVKKGFFETGEIKTAINFLRCLVNPRQDIPFAQVLLSPLVKASNEELGRLVSKNGFLYDDILAALSEGKPVPEPIVDFLKKYNFLKLRSGILPVTRLLDEVYDVTGLYRLVLGMPAGGRRAANLDFFREQAVDFEKTGSAGLSEFLAYLDNCDEQNVDFGEASAENTSDAVQIMTIHHSKGLEYPVVIIPQIFKGRNDSDRKATLVVHPKFGPSLDHVDYERRTKTKTLRKSYFSECLKAESVAEELRVLYVAVTRAREKLVLIGACDDIEKKIPEPLEVPEMSYVDLMSSQCFFDFIKGALFRDEDLTGRLKDFAKELNEAYKEPAEGDFHTFDPLKVRKRLVSSTTGNTVDWDISIVPGHGKLINVAVRGEKTEEAKKFAADVLEGRVPVSKDQEEELFALKKAADFVYPFKKFTTAAVKHSVSELKHENGFRLDLAPEDDYDRGAKAGWLADPGKTKPQFAAAGKTSREPSSSAKTDLKTAAKRGTATHRVMELLPFEKPLSLQETEAFAKECESKGLLAAGEAELVYCEAVADFMKTELFERMSKAKKAGKLFREQAFTIGLQAEGGTEDDLNLIQGVIDAYFEEDGEAVLVDYKTDKASPEAIKERYLRQLELYSEAVSRVRGLKVKERLIYSFENNCLISL